MKIKLNISRKSFLNLALVCGLISGSLVASISTAAAQTTPQGGWIGLGKLDSIKFTSLEPTRCSYRLVRTGSTFPYFPGSTESTAIGYLPLSGYDEAQIAKVGRISSLKFEVPLSRVGDFALAVYAQYSGGAYFFASRMQTMKIPSCQIIWSYGRKVLPTDTTNTGPLKPILKCSDLHFDNGTLPQENEISDQIVLDPAKLSLQKDSSCK